MKFCTILFTSLKLLTVSTNIGNILSANPGDKEFVGCTGPVDRQNSKGHVSKVVSCTEDYANDNAAREISKYGLAPVGSEMTESWSLNVIEENDFENVVRMGKPMGTVSKLEPFTGELFFEASSEGVINPNVTLKVSIWNNGAIGDCNKQGAEEKYTLNSNNITIDNDYNTAYTTTVEAAIENYVPQTENGEQVIYKSVTQYPYATNNENAVVYRAAFALEDIKNSTYGFYNADANNIEMCIRAEYQTDYSGDSELETISYLDTNYNVNLVAADSSSFDSTAVSIFKSSPSSTTAKVQAVITTSAYLCDDVNAEITNAAPVTAGETFRLCVSPNQDPSSNFNYKVTGFNDVTCGNDGETRNLVQGGDTDALTDIDFTNFGGATSTSLAVESVVTAKLLAVLENDENPNVFTCSGSVLLGVLALTPASTPAPTPTQAPTYKKEPVGVNTCSSGYTPITSVEDCENAVAFWDGPGEDLTSETEPDYPKGCYVMHYGNAMDSYFNFHATGSPEGESQIMCVKNTDIILNSNSNSNRFRNMQQEINDDQELPAEEAGFGIDITLADDSSSIDSSAVVVSGIVSLMMNTFMIIMSMAVITVL